MSLDPIQTFWHGRPFTKVEKLSIASFLANGHPVHLYVYEEPVDKLPEGVVLHDASAIMERSEMFANENEGFGHGSLAPFSNLFRGTLLYKRGGWWSDLDVICLKPWILDPPELIATSWEENSVARPNCNVMRLNKGNEVLARWLELLWQRYTSKVEHGQGPLQLVQALEEMNRMDLCVPYPYFNPIGWRHVRHMLYKSDPIWKPQRIKRMLGLRPKIGKIRRETVAVHLWSEMWSYRKLDRNGDYYPDSIFEQLKKRYGV